MEDSEFLGFLDQIVDVTTHWRCRCPWSKKQLCRNRFSTLQEGFCFIFFRYSLRLLLTPTVCHKFKKIANPKISCHILVDCYFGNLECMTCWPSRVQSETFSRRNIPHFCCEWRHGPGTAKLWVEKKTSKPDCRLHGIGSKKKSCLTWNNKQNKYWFLSQISNLYCHLDWQWKLIWTPGMTNVINSLPSGPETSHAIFKAFWLLH